MKRRSSKWFAKDDLRSFGHRSRAKQMGWNDSDFRRPVIAIVSTWNELNTCHTHFPERVADIKRGIIEAGGTPAEMPAMSLGEQLMKPSAMMFRNLLAMQTEEMLRAYPIDGAVLMGGCDKTTPGVLMGAISANLPCIYMPAGAMMRGHFRGQTLGSGTDVWKHWEERRAGKLSKKMWAMIEDGIARTPGTCMTMGTAATMMIAAEALGFSLPGASSIPAIDSQHRRLGRATGARAVELVLENLRPSDVLSRQSFANAAAAVCLCGGSTNAVIHLTALARRAGLQFSPSDFAAVSDKTPLLLNLKPSGEYVMEDFHRAGGIRALFYRARKHFYLRAKTVAGKTFGKCISADAESFDDNVIRPLKNPLQKSGGLRILSGTLAPDGCIIKISAMESRLLKHSGPAVVFENMKDLKARIDSPTLRANADSVLVLKNAGPKGGPGMPEWGQLPIPKKLAKIGVRDMVRISDARMSGTSYGACVLHIAPEAAADGPLSLVQDGDIIAMDVNRRRLDLEVAPAELARRRKAHQQKIAAVNAKNVNATNKNANAMHSANANENAANENANANATKYRGGYARLYVHHVLQANEGCDFDFASQRPGDTPEPDIF